MDNNSKTSPSMRVLTRPQSTPQPQSPPLPPPSPGVGVVVVGFICGSHSHLLNRILDSDFFGSTPRGNSFHFPEVTDFFKDSPLSYFHDPLNGVVFVHFSSTQFPATSNPGFDQVEFAQLQGLLFIFTVCHVVIYIQEGSCFDTQVLKRLRVLQSAKNALMPFLRSHNILPSVSRPSPSSRPPAPGTSSSKTPSPRRGSAPSTRNNSSMSGLGLHTTLFPGQCTPVTLFVFIDDLSDLVNTSSLAEELVDSSMSNQPPLSNIGRSSNMGVKSSSSVVMLSRVANKSEGSLRKKLQSSLEAQIQFLIKKCRTLSGFESNSHGGSRSGAYSGSAPLLTLDASRAVVLLDNASTKRSESLEFATCLVEEVLNGKVSSDSLLLESHGQRGSEEDIMTLKDFIFRQCDILRGKGGGLVANANNGGVGMVAVAAAAAAASVASGRSTTTVPELPSLEMWLTSCQLILKGILSAKRGSADESDIIIKRKSRQQRNGVPPPVEGIPPKALNTADTSVLLLESAEGTNRKFSTLWCQRAVPAAMEIYLKDLPPCYPTSLHEAQLEKAIHAFHSMAKGPSMQLFMKKLEEECLLIWKSGRQLCDSVSLTGKPCMHKRHDTEDDDDCRLDSIGREHSSGFVFLHACACGRSRQIRPDPFDFEVANVTFNVFPDCDKLLPMLQLPKTSYNGASQPVSWTVVRLGGAKYYDPSKGLLQTGFSSNQKFLLRWTVVLEKEKRTSVSFANALRQGYLGSAADVKPQSTTDENAQKGDAPVVQMVGMQAKVESYEKDIDNSKSDKKKISFGRGLPNITMRKAFSEVVAGSASSNSAFPPLQPRVQPSLIQGKGVTENKGDAKKSKISGETASTGGENLTGTNNVDRINRNPFLQIGSTVVPLNADDGRNINEKNMADIGKGRFDPSFTRFVVYVGFEHECPHGHRFLLSPELLNQLGHPYSLAEESYSASSMEHVNRKHKGPVKMGKSDGHSKGQRPSNAKIIHKGSNFGNSGEVLIDKYPTANENSCVSKPVDQTALDPSIPPESVVDIQHIQDSVKVDNDGPAFSLLNRNIPIYMNCPHCRASKSRKDGQNLNYAGTISQLQRIFVVTPQFPIVLAANPIVQFEGSYQPTVVSSHEQELQFSLGCRVILPPESFVSIRLPFVYGIEVKDKGMLPLNPFEHQPELTAWIKQSTALQLVCKGSNTE